MNYTNEDYYFYKGYENDNFFNFSPQLLSHYQNEKEGKEESFINENCNNNMKINFPNPPTEIETKANSKEIDEEFKNKVDDLSGASDQIDNMDKKSSPKSKPKKTKKKEKRVKKEKKKCGRIAMRDSDKKTEHNKYSDDNLRRKCKHLVLKYILKFINYQILIVYNGNIGNGIFKKQLQTLNQSQKSDATINFNKMFLNKTLAEIFSENISGRFTNFPPNHNKLLIEKLMNENDEEKRIYFNNIFSLTFIQCLKHFTGEIKIDLLDGLKCFEDIKNDIMDNYEDDGLDYYNTLKYYLNNFEVIINNKKARQPRK
jgi:hypothetical protein